MVPSSTYACGFGAFSREKFLTLGGYDELYFPGILEDMDLCLRARRAGFHLYYEPRSLVFHMGQASFKRAYSDLKRETLAFRNTFLFMWKNFHGPRFWVTHLFFLPFRMIGMLLRGRWGFAPGFLEALLHSMRNSISSTSNSRNFAQGAKNRETP
jgi:GT2 family glycosyltransferase